MALVAMLMLPIAAQAKPTTPFQKALAAAPVNANAASVTFSRAPLMIHPSRVEGKQGEATIIRPDVTIDAEVRGVEALKLDYIHTLNSLTESTGVLILLDAPAPIALPKMQVFTPVDVLVVAADGAIQTIIPNVTLGNLAQAMPIPKPAKALLFLKNGEATSHGIKPHDTIAGAMFSQAVKVQE